MCVVQMVVTSASKSTQMVKASDGWVVRLVCCCCCFRCCWLVPVVVVREAEQRERERGRGAAVTHVCSSQRAAQTAGSPALCSSGRSLGLADESRRLLPLFLFLLRAFLFLLLIPSLLLISLPFHLLPLHSLLSFFPFLPFSF